jgi:polysaccharide export outer membrane protein
MKTVIVTALLALPAWCQQQQKAPPTPVLQSPKATIPAGSLDPGSARAASADPDSPPARMAAPPGVPKAAVATPINNKTYVIGVEDVLNILVWGNTALTGDVTVRPDGIITLGLINDVKAVGLTPEELTDLITTRLKDGGFMQSPRVTVSVKQVNSRKACIVGQVMKPGCFNLIVPTNVLQALVNAGGFQEFAKTKSIVVQRGDDRFPFNYNRVISGKSREQNILLEPDDLIIVK